MCERGDRATGRPFARAGVPRPTCVGADEGIRLAITDDLADALELDLRHMSVRPHVVPNHETGVYADELFLRCHERDSKPLGR